MLTAAERINSRRSIADKRKNSESISDWYLRDSKDDHHHHHHRLQQQQFQTSNHVFTKKKTDLIDVRMENFSKIQQNDIKNYYLEQVRQEPPKIVSGKNYESKKFSLFVSVNIRLRWWHRQEWDRIRSWSNKIRIITKSINNQWKGEILSLASNLSFLFEYFIPFTIEM